MTQAVSIAQGGTNNVTMRNRIINGAMMIDQRNAGASVTPTASGYTLDRWAFNISQASKASVQQNAGSVTPPAGYKNYLGVTSTSAYSPTTNDYFTPYQAIEGLNTYDLGWGAAGAATVTLSFWVRSSLTGTFGGALKNGSAARTYPFSYTINNANTWEQKTVTIAGDTSGTWATDNSVGIYVVFSVGNGSAKKGTAGAWSSSNYDSCTGSVDVVATSGATFYITGVQLEAGTTATPFENRLYGTELALCQRYYYRQALPYNVWVGPIAATGTGLARGFMQFPTTMRAAPTALEQSGTVGDYSLYDAGTAYVCTAVPTFVTAGTQSGTATFTVASGLTTGHAGFFGGNAGAGYLGWSAEL